MHLYNYNFGNASHVPFRLDQRASVAECAAYVIAHGAISLDAKLGIFTVRSTVEPRVVQLFPKLACSCPAGCGLLPHRMHGDVQRRTLNLTQLRKNKRNRPDRTSGRKRPRIADVDVIAAPGTDPLPETVTHQESLSSLRAHTPHVRQQTWNQMTMPTTR